VQYRVERIALRLVQKVSLALRRFARLGCIVQSDLLTNGASGWQFLRLYSLNEFV
jgi:hypothetical protein